MSTITPDPGVFSLPSALLVLEHSSDAVILADLDHRMLYVNRSTEVLCAKDRSDLLGGLLVELLQPLAEDHRTPLPLAGLKLTVIGDTFIGPAPQTVRASDGRILSLDVKVTRVDEGYLYQFTSLSTVREIERHILLQANLLDHVHKSIIATDRDGTILYWNATAESLYGWKAAEVVGENIYDIVVPPSIRDRAKQAFLAWSIEGALEGEFIEIRKDGSEFLSQVRVTEVRDTQNKRIGFIGLSRDLTLERATQSELKQSISLLHATLQATEDGILVVDNEGHISAWNEQFVRMWQIPEAIIASGSDAAVLEVALKQLADPSAFLAKVQELYASTEAESFDVLPLKDGRIFERTSRPQRIDGSSVGRVWCFRDVTSRYRDQFELREQKSLYESLINAQSDMGEGFVIATPTRVLFSNDAIASITGYTKEDLTSFDTILQFIVPEERARLGRQLERRLRGEPVPDHYETRILHKSGKVIDVEVGIKRRAVNDTIELIIIIRNITQRKEIERSLISSEAKFRTVVDNLGEAIVITDTEGKILYMNTRLEELSGYSTSECLGRVSHVLMMPEAEWTRAKERIERRKQGVQESYELLFKRKDGELRWCSVNAVPYRTLEGAIVGTVAAITDIHEKKQTEIELRRAEERFRFMTLATSDVVYDWAIETNEIWWNEAFTRLLRMDPQDHLDMDTWSKRVHPDDLPRVLKGLQAAIEQRKQVWGDEYRIRRQDDTYADIIDRGYVIFDDETGAPVRMIGAMMDVTDRKRAEQEIRKAAANTAALIENTSDAILSLDKELRLITFNSSFQEMFRLHNGVNPYPGLDLKDYFLRQEAELWTGIFERVMRGEHFTVVRHRKIENIERVYEMAFNPISENNEVVGIAIFDQDITERKQMEDQLIAEKERAEEMSRLKSSFLANMSHEIRTPMTAILGFASIIREHSHSEELDNYANTIERSGTRLLATINGILDLAKIEANKIDIRHQVLDPKTEIVKTTEFYRSLALAKGLELETSFEGTGPILADELYLGQVLTNLIGNALKFTPAGSIRIELANEPSNVVIRVIDTGIGISPDFLPHIFDEFKQESGGYARNYEGSGLGLTITKRLVELMDGTIEAQSELGKGSVFTLRFPIATTGEIATGHEAESRLQQREPVKHPTGKYIPKVLLVEDTSDTAEMVRIFMLGKCQLEFARSAEEALWHVEKDTFDLLLMDVNLGEGPSGLEVTRVIRKKQSYKQTPIVALTAFAMKGDRESAMDAGCTDYLSKPFTKAELLNKIGRFLER